MGSSLDEPHYKKTVDFGIGGVDLRFHVSQTLFSSHEIDVGTEFLLRTIHRMEGDYQKVLDLGCGYGPIGVSLKGLYPNAAVHMVDRDALAVRYAAQNATLNGLDDVSTYPSIGFDDINERDFDLIVTNIPGKAGKPVIASWLTEAPHFLRPGGQVALVVVSALESLFDEVMSGIPSAETVLRQRRAGHTVFRYTAEPTQDPSFPATSSFERGGYDRSHATFTHRRTEYSLKTVFGLPQFDSLSYRTLLLFDVLKTLKRQPLGKRVLTLNPGQGHVPALLSKAFMPSSIVLVDRDLLALRCSARGLSMNGYDPARVSSHHADNLEGDETRYDLIVAEMRDDEGPEAIASLFRQAANRLAPGGQMVVTAGSAAITRLTKICRAEGLATVGTRKRRQGNSVLVVSAK